MNRTFFFLLLLAAFATSLAAQDFGFGFGDDDAAIGVAGGNSGVAISGEVSASFLGYVDDFSKLDETELGDIFSGKLNFSAGNSFGEAVINLNLSLPAADGAFDSPVAFDEAYLRAYLGVFEIEGGLRKLTWGKADSFGPLDVINPLDYREITDASDALNMKIARPLVHATARFGQFSKLEAVFVPTFEPHRFASDGRWIPAQMAALQTQIAAAAALALAQNPPLSPPAVVQPNTSTLNYAQAGLRFTTTFGSSDIGAQYYYGRLPTPAVKLSFNPTQPPALSAVEFLYNPYHHIGVDYAQVLFGFNIRAEFAANITSDLGGDDGEVYNPSLAWSLGFDRDLVWGINLNIQGNETVRLLHGNIHDNPMLDIEAGVDMTSTRITAILSKKFLRDELEARFVALWEVEAKDFFIMPGIIWTRDAVQVEVSGGIFGGDEKGQFGQYYKNNFVKVGLTYSF
ncbi:MAG: hypothetical protein LBK73_15895 [Treponema sp.]|jgi:hypothetical protein|nr:hypothetical protein [Treponema sp.]